MTKLDALPSEILSLILTHVSKKDLPSCALINRFLYREAMALLWRTLVMGTRREYTTFTTCLMQSPNAPGHHVRSLTFGNMDALGQVQDVPTLESQGNYLHHIPRYCPHLASLIIWGEPGAYRIVHAIIFSVGQYRKQLTRLDLHDCDYYDRLLGILAHTPLTHIQLSLSYKVDTETGLGFAETAPLALYRYQQLTTLWIGSHFHDNTGFITTINGLTWPHLTRFTLERDDAVTDAMALLFVQAHPKLECLNLKFGQLTDAFLDALVDSLPNLKTLDVVCNPAMTAPGMCRLIKNYGGRLTEVHCEGCDINPEDVPNDKTYDYRVVEKDGEELDVGWFSGTFCDYTESDKIYKTMEPCGYI